MGKRDEQVTAGDLTELVFLERLAARMPDDVEVLTALGDLYTRVGHYERGLAVDRRLAALCADDPEVWYNLGCSLALLQQRGEALAALNRAIELGYDDRDWMCRDDDLRSLRDDQAFRALLKQIAS